MIRFTPAVAAIVFVTAGCIAPDCPDQINNHITVSNRTGEAGWIGIQVVDDAGGVVFEGNLTVTGEGVFEFGPYALPNGGFEFHAESEHWGNDAGPWQSNCKRSGAVVFLDDGAMDWTQVIYERKP